MTRVLLGLLCWALLIVGSASSSFAYSTYFGEDLSSNETRLASWSNASTAEAAFLSNLTGVGTETFEGFTEGVAAPLPITFPGAGTATLNGDGFINSVGPGLSEAGRYPISGTKFWESRGTFTIDFSDPIAAFGFYGVDIGDFGGQLTASLLSGGTLDLIIPNTIGSGGSTGGSVLFWGIIDTANLFTSITFGNTSGRDDAFAFDNMTIGSLEQVAPVPEPSTFLLLGGGLAGLAFVRRRKKE